MSNILSNFLNKTTGESEVEDEERLPDSFDELVHKSELERDSENVRNASPSHELRESISKSGILQPLIVRDDDEKQRLQITDGWQRYQAATSLGFMHLPVNIYGDTYEALQAAEEYSIVREWTSYQMARHAQSIKDSIEGDHSSRSELIERTADSTSRHEKTIERYMNAFRLPDILHPLLKERENVSEREWMALKNYHKDVRRHSGLSWQVAAKAGKHADMFEHLPNGEEKLIRLMLETLSMNANQAEAFIDEFIEDPDRSFDMVSSIVFDGPGPEEKGQLEIPHVYVKIKPEHKSKIMDHITTRKKPLDKMIQDLIRARARELEDDNTSLSEFNQNN